MGALSQNLFTMIVAMAVVTTMAMPPMLRWALARVPMGKAEKERLEARGIRGEGVRPEPGAPAARRGRQRERQVRRAARGLDCAPARIPMTVYRSHAYCKGGAGRNGKRSRRTPRQATARAMPRRRRPKTASAGKATRIRAAARRDQSASRPRRARRRWPSRGRATTCCSSGSRIRGKDGGFHGDVARVASGFDGPIAIGAAKAVHLEQPRARPLRILVPVNGTEVSRRAADVALAIARACAAPSPRSTSPRVQPAVRASSAASEPASRSRRS